MTVIRRNPASVAALDARRLATARARARTDLGACVARIRLCFITDLPGQGEIYAEKEREARAYLGLPALPNQLTDFPFLDAELGITAPSAYELAQLWLNLAALWRQVAAVLEKARTAANAQIEAAPSAEAAAGIAQATVAALETAFAATLVAQPPQET